MEDSPNTPADYDEETTFNDGQIDDQTDAGDETMANMEESLVAEADGGEQHQLNGRPYALPDEPTDYSLFSNPPSLGLVRQRLFEIEDKVELSPTDFNTYFPFVDNVWRKSRTGDPQKENSTLTEWYWCRLRKPSNHKTHTPKPTPEGKKTRKKRVREDITCGMSMKVIFTEGVVKSCTIVRGVGPETKHTHDLDYMDQLKRNAGVMDIARREAVRGFLPASVFQKMAEEQDKLNAAGGKFMKVSDVRNVQYAWRQDNPSVVLKAHTGYTQLRSATRPRMLASPKPRTQQNHIEPPLPPPVVPVQSLPPGTLQYPEHAREFLEPYLPHIPPAQSLPHITLTYASSLDSRLSVMPGVQTAISGPETKAMTHYLRSRHDAVLIGVRTAIADDPSLNCRLAGAGGYGGIGWTQQPRPIIVDPHARLHIRPDMRMLKIVSEGRARAPWVIVAPGAMLHPVAVSTLKAHGGEYLMIQDFSQQGLGLNWEGLFQILFKEGIKSVMIEGGGIVLSELLKLQNAHLIDSVIITIAPTFLGKAGTSVSPDPAYDNGKPLQNRLKQVRWQPMGEEDVVLCGKLRDDSAEGQADGILQGIEEFSRTAADIPSTTSANGQPQPIRPPPS